MKRGSSWTLTAALAAALFAGGCNWNVPGKNDGRSLIFAPAVTR